MVVDIMTFITEQQAIDEKLAFQLPPDSIDMTCEPKGFESTWDRIGNGFYRYQDKIWVMYRCMNPNCEGKEPCFGTSKLYLLTEEGKVVKPEDLLQDYTNT